MNSRTTSNLVLNSLVRIYWIYLGTFDNSIKMGVSFYVDRQLDLQITDNNYIQKEHSIWNHPLLCRAETEETDLNHYRHQQCEMLQTKDQALLQSRHDCDYHRDLQVRIIVFCEAFWMLLLILLFYINYDMWYIFLEYWSILVTFSK